MRYKGIERKQFERLNEDDSGYARHFFNCVMLLHKLEVMW